jgi:hypothetical protein
MPCDDSKVMVYDFESRGLFGRKRLMTKEERFKGRFLQNGSFISLEMDYTFGIMYILGSGS